MLTTHLSSERAIELPNSCQSEELHSGAPTTARSESYSEVHSGRNRVCRRRAYWPTETHRQVRLDKVSLEQATVSVFDRKAFVNQGRESRPQVIYVERYPSSHSEPSMLPVVRSFLRVVQRVGTVRLMPLVKRTQYGRVIAVRYGVAARAIHWRRSGKKKRSADASS